MKTAAMEREVKLNVGLEFALPDLTGVVKGVTESALPRAELVAVYFDTPDRRLLRRGITLRHRRDRVDPAGGGTWTLKLPVEAAGPTLERNELSWPGEMPAVPAEAIQLLRGVLRYAELGPIAELVTSRRRFEIRDPNGRRLAEVDDDTVAVMEGLKLAKRFREVEVELEADDESLLDSVVSRLAAAGATRAKDGPKLARALGAEPSSLRPKGPRHGRGSTVAEVVTGVIGAGLDQLLRHELGVRLSGDVEHVHQARVATRRLRSNLRTFGDVLDPAWTVRIRDELKWLGGALGRVRDADVLAARLQAQAAEELTDADQRGFGRLQERLSGERQDAYDALLAVLATERYIDLIDELAAAPLPLRHGTQTGTSASMDPCQPAKKALIPLVRRPWRKLRRAVADLDRRPSDQDLHQIRIKAKRLRYAAEALSVVVETPARRLSEAAADLQDVLGAHHDAVTAETWLREAAATLADSGGTLVAGELITVQRHQQERLRQTWQQVWTSLNVRRLRRWLE